MGSCVPFSFGHPWPICLPWASSALLLTLYSHGFLLTLLSFPDPITSYSYLGFMGLLSIPYSLYLHCFGPAAAHFYFFSHHTLSMGLLLTISLFLGSFEPICLLKAHLLISWTCDPLFMSLGLNGFFVLCLLPTSLCCWVGLPFLHLGFTKKRHSTFSPLNIWSAPAAHMWIKNLFVPSTFLLSFPSRAFLNYRPLLIYISFSSHEQ